MTQQTGPITFPKELLHEEIPADELAETPDSDERTVITIMFFQSSMAGQLMNYGR